MKYIIIYSDRKKKNALRLYKVIYSIMVWKYYDIEMNSSRIQYYYITYALLIFILKNE